MLNRRKVSVTLSHLPKTTDFNQISDVLSQYEASGWEEPYVVIVNTPVDTTYVVKGYRNETDEEFNRRLSNLERVKQILKKNQN